MTRQVLPLRYGERSNFDEAKVTAQSTPVRSVMIRVGLVIVIFSLTWPMR